MSHSKPDFKFPDDIKAAARRLFPSETNPELHDYLNRDSPAAISKMRPGPATLPVKTVMDMLAAGDVDDLKRLASELSQRQKVYEQARAHFDSFIGNV